MPRIDAAHRNAGTIKTERHGRYRKTTMTTLNAYELYAGVAGMPHDDDAQLIGIRYTQGAAHRDALAMLANPYSWVLVIEAATGVATLNVMAEHRGRAH